MSHIYEFIRFCRRLTLDGLASGRGGNCSIKLNNEILITPSGVSISNILCQSDICRCKLSSLNEIKNEKDYFQKGKDLVIDECRNNYRPSMEYGMHCLLPYKYIVHLHPTELNIILCSAEASVIIGELFNKTLYDFVDYVTPGFELFQTFQRRGVRAPIIFLQNHGVIVCGSSEDEIFDKIIFIQNTVANYLNRPLYPDAACLPSENVEINREILQGIRRMGLTPKYLTLSEIEDLKNLDYEKHRASLP